MVKKELIEQLINEIDDIDGKLGDLTGDSTTSPEMIRFFYQQRDNLHNMIDMLKKYKDKL